MTNNKPQSIGKIRQSQALHTFGIGAIVDFRYHSAMPLGLDLWPPQNRCRTIYEPDLQLMLDKDWFQAPPVVDDDGPKSALLKATRFPRWLFCPECKALGMVREIRGDGQGQHDDGIPDFGPKVAFISQNGGKPKCTRQRMNGSGTCNGVGVPTRLVTVCYQQPGRENDHPGHIDDFPWYEWVHQDDPSAGRKKDTAGEKVHHYLSLESLEKTLAIEDLVVKCAGCRKSRSLKGVFNKDFMKKFGCRGWRPWLENYQDKEFCGRPVKAFLRGATNLHLPISTSVISIPPVSDYLTQAFSEHMQDLVERWRDDCEDRAEEGRDPPGKRRFAERQLQRCRERGFDREADFSDEDVIESVVKRLGGDDDDPDGTRSSHKGRRYQECKALRKGEENPHSDFDAVLVDVPSNWQDYIQTLVKVRKLRKIEALRGFRRDSQGNPDAPELQDDRYAPLSLNRGRWLPAIEMKGEGLFIELNLERVREWEEQPEVAERMTALRNQYGRQAELEGWENPQCPSARYILVHTLSHLLIRQLTLECGYSSASLQERLYVATPEDVAAEDGPGGEMAGGLIYTATTDSDGSFGGLVRMGEPDRFDVMIAEGLRSATWCSSDPVCATVEGQGSYALNRAACHACALVPETSCERRNTFLDRLLVVSPRGIPGDASFFPAVSFTDT